MKSRSWLYLVLVSIVAVVLALMVVQMRGIPGPTRPHDAIGAEAQQLRQAFNADAGRVRIVALVSPTCGACLRGAAEIQSDVFDEIDHEQLRGFVLWVPKLGGSERDVPEATHTVSDARVTHYWDEEGFLVQAYNKRLALGEDAWDIYLLYGPDARWDGAEPPAPALSMDQLPGTAPALFTPAQLAAEVRTQLR